MGGRSSQQVSQVMGPLYANKVVLNDGEVGPDIAGGSNVAVSLQLCMLSLKGNHMKELEPGRQSVDYESIRTSEEFKRYLSLSKELRLLKLDGLNESERKALFINVYNSLVIHGQVNGLLGSTSLWSRLRFYAAASYQIGDYLYCLNDIENGILRANKRSAAPLTAAPFASSDPRLAFSLPTCDPRIHFALNCGARSCPPVAFYSSDPAQLESQLEMAAQGFIEQNVKIHAGSNLIELSPIFQWYEEDFGGSSSVLLWIADHSPPHIGTTVSDLLKSKTRPVVKYSEYNWELND